MPVATYRVQFSPEFTFGHAAALAPYFKQLGVSHLYASPCLKATEGSRHGYDVVDPHQVNPQLGGEEGHRILCKSLKKSGLGQVLDIVPNHMAAHARENLWWRNVLQHGRGAPYAAYFDIDWDVSDPKIRNKVLVPVLGDHYARSLDAGHIQLRRRGIYLSVCYFDRELPLSPQTLGEILLAASQRPGVALLAETAEAMERAAQSDTETRIRKQEKLLKRLENTAAENPGIDPAIDAVLSEINADPDRLHRCLEAQHYRLAFWRTASSDINYRRFFDIDDLVGICVEKKVVFSDIHRRILQWIETGLIDGLRVDHPDGLRNPAQYLRNLRNAAPGSWILVEKILEPGERLRKDWPVSGTTGYDFLNRVGGMFIDADGEQAMTDVYRDITGQAADFEEVVRLKKLQVMADSFDSEITRLTCRLVDLRSRHRQYRDLVRGPLRDALKEIIACFPVYRTYICAEPGQIAEEDRRTVEAAVEKARTRRTDLEDIVWEFFTDLLLLRLSDPGASDFVMRLQQFTGQVMAKGLEDTAFYCFNRLISLNEVGGDPGQFGASVDAFHRFCGFLQAHWPQTMLATATHDTKRGEDTRLRIHMLSEIPDQWSEAVRRWFRINAGFRHNGLPDPNTEYFLYQTIVGAWPVSLQRLQPYMEKAVREAKVHTSWTRPDERYEAILKRFVENILTYREFIDDLEAFLDPLLEPARISSISQSLIRLTAPGIPDLYQGTELWDLSLVDPDNRRPVDFDARQRLLEELDGLTVEKIWSRLDQGLPKLFTIQKVLSVRQRYPAVFGPQGTYRPLRVEGGKSDHAVAFIRKERIATIAPCRVFGLNGDWSDTIADLPEGAWRNAFTHERYPGGKLPLARLLARFPVALLVNEHV